VFPVVSNLRRSAMKIIYTDTPNVRFESRHFCLDFSTGRWEKSGKALMSKIEAPGADEIERAVRLCVFENGIYDNSGAGEFQYTLIVGREEEAEDVRSIRMGLVKGILASRLGGLVPMRNRPAQASPFRKPLPPGVVLDER